METHIHHVHKPEGKKIKHILFEFFMLFLAVTLGFFVENQREHLLEKERSFVLAKSLAADLRKDTAALQEAIALSENKLICADSITAMLKETQSPLQDTMIYKCMAPVLSVTNFIPTDGTYSQLKAAGTLRYFNQPLVNALNDYAVQMQKTRQRDEFIKEANWKVVDAIMNVMNMEVIGQFRQDQPITGNLTIAFNSENEKAKLINLIYLNRLLKARCLLEYKEQLKGAENILRMLKKDYNTE